MPHRWLPHPPLKPPVLQILSQNFISVRRLQKNLTLLCCNLSPWLLVLSMEEEVKSLLLSHLHFPHTRASRLSRILSVFSSLH